VVYCAVCTMKADSILIRYTIVSTAKIVVTLSRWMEYSGNVLDGGLVSRPQRSCNGRQRTGRTAQCAGRGAWRGPFASLCAVPSGHLRQVFNCFYHRFESNRGDEVVGPLLVLLVLFESNYDECIMRCVVYTMGQHWSWPFPPRDLWVRSRGLLGSTLQRLNHDTIQSRPQMRRQSGSINGRS
jgi:hypothetical protein